MTPVDLEELARLVRESEGLVRKREIRLVTGPLTAASPHRSLKDDAALVETGRAKLLIAADSIVSSLCEALPRFAGWCAVTVTANDVWATGGRPMAATTVLGARGAAELEAIAEGAAAAAEALGIEIVGGHVNPVGSCPAASATVVGEVNIPLSAGGARPGDKLAAAIDLQGRWVEGWTGAWNSHDSKEPKKLREDLSLLPRIAEGGLATACKDVSNAGVLGTLAILLETSGRGGRIDIGEVPRPGNVSWKRWAGAFPSYGFLFAVPPGRCGELVGLFTDRGIAARVVGEVTEEKQVFIEDGGRQTLLFDFGKERIL